MEQWIMSEPNQIENRMKNEKINVETPTTLMGTLEFHNDSKVNSYLIKKLPADNKKRISMENKLQHEFFVALTKGDKNKASDIFEQFTTTNELGQFYRKIFITWINSFWGITYKKICSNI